jgi:tetratricopeptide (TPR) repeat protein
VALSQIVFPYEISPFPKFTPTKIIVGCLVFIMLICILIKRTETSRWKKLFFLFWFFLFLFPSFFIKSNNIDYLEHRYLLPQIGIFILFIKLLQNITLPTFCITSFLSSKIYYLLIFIILFFGATSFIKARTLQNPLTVAEATLKYGGICTVPYTNRGAYYLDRERYEEAIVDYDKVLRFDSRNTVALNNLAKINMIYQEYENAIALYTFSIAINNRMDGPYYNRSIAKMRTGDFEGALHDADSAIRINKNAALLYNNRGALRMYLGFSQAALEDFNEAVKLSNFLYSDALGNRAFVKSKLGDIEGALQDCEKAIAIEPTNEEFLKLKENILNE